MLLAIYAFLLLLAHWNGGQISFLWLTIDSSLTSADVGKGLVCSLGIFGFWAYYLIMCVATLNTKGPQT